MTDPLVHLLPPRRHCARRRRHSASTLLATLVATGALLLAACGQPDPEPAATTEPVPAPEPPPPAPEPPAPAPEPPPPPPEPAPPEPPPAPPPEPPEPAPDPEEPEPAPEAAADPYAAPASEEPEPAAEPLPSDLLSRPLCEAAGFVWSGDDGPCVEGEPPAGGEDLAGEPAVYDAPGELEVPLPLPPGEPGEIIDVEMLDVGEDHIGYRVLYYSRSLRGDDIAVSGFVATPAGEPPPGGWPLVAYAHGTTGTADICAPSHEAEVEIASNASYLEGYAVAATDYEGLGTPGLHPYIVGRSEARGVLDSVRAAHNLGNVHDDDGAPLISVSDEFVVWGHSQGGHAAIHAGQHWAEYAPELSLLGVASGAPPSQFALLYGVLLGGPFQGYLAMASAAFAEAYDEIELDQVYTDQAIALMDVLETGCTQDVFDVFNPLTAEEMLKVASPLGVSPWDRVIVENDSNQAPVPVPLLILHGSDDEQIPALSSQILLGQLCVQDGQGPTDRILYEGHNHGSVIAAQRDDLLDWIADRFAGEPAPDTCA